MACAGANSAPVHAMAPDEELIPLGATRAGHSPRYRRTEINASGGPTNCR